ncbi:hypothetical protein DQ353_11990 [Arthrobacter sp. AQ5-05]|nr:hypothetical protein DQ353_11990 [Arthrobacter sp. AQ5-05]
MHDPAATEDLVARILECYRQSVPPDIFLLHSHCRIADVARRVLGVGSVGIR